MEQTYYLTVVYTIIEINSYRQKSKVFNNMLLRTAYVLEFQGIFC